MGLTRQHIESGVQVPLMNPATAAVGRTTRVSINRILVSLAVIAYPLALLWVLRSIVSIVFAYEGYAFQPPENPAVTILVLALTIMPGFLMPRLGIRPSHAIVWILYILAYVPAQIVPVFSTGRSFESYGPFQVSLFAGMLIVLAFGALPPIRFPQVRLNPNLFWLFMAAFSALVYASVIRQYGLPNQVPGLAEVYDVRSHFGEESIGQGPFLPYGMGWQYKIVNPLLMTVGLTRRSPLFLVSGTLGQIFLYSYSGHKTVLFSLLLVFGLYFLTRNAGKWLGLGFAAGASLVVAASVVFDLIADSVWGTSLFVRRLMMVPGMLTGYYHEFFSENPFTQQFGPFLRPFVDSPYTMSIPNTIGSVYFGNPQTAANANLWADGYSSFGYIGVIVFSLILGLIVWAFNSVGLGANSRAAVIVGGVASFSWVNSALMTSVWTHGIALAILLLIFFPADAGDRANPAPRAFRFIRARDASSRHRTEI